MAPVCVTTREAPLWKCPFTSTELCALLRLMLLEAGAPLPDSPGSPPVLELMLTNDRDMAVLHKQSLGCDGPTNILSFPCAFQKDKNTCSPLGSMALSVDTMARECFLYEQDPREHCIRLVAHGLAHVLGHDHGQTMQDMCERLEKAAAKFACSANAEY